MGIRAARGAWRPLPCLPAESGSKKVVLGRKKMLGKEIPFLFRITGGRCGGHTMGLVHVDRNGFMDGLVFLREISIIFIIRIKEL